MEEVRMVKVSLAEYETKRLKELGYETEDINIFKNKCEKEIEQKIISLVSDPFSRPFNTFFK
jgi:hypothetical protein